MLYFLNIPVLFGYSLEVYAIMLVIAIPTYFVWRWLLKKFIKDNHRRIIFSCFLTFIVTPIIYSGLIILFILSLTYERIRDFSKSQWLTNSEGRYEMAENLIDRELLIGKDSTQVKSIIGPPQWRTENGREWNYNMGFGGGLGFVSHNLLLKFENNKVFLVEHVKVRD